jgi:hypothetical protein
MTETDQQQAPQPGSFFGVPKFSTQARFVPDNQNSNLGVTPLSGTQVNVPTTRLDQLDIVRGIKIYTDLVGTWTQAGGETLVQSPFFPANSIQQITFKLQAAYNTFNLTGPLASICQSFRPMWGYTSQFSNPNAFANNNGNNPMTPGTAFHERFGIDIPFAMKFDEYFDLNATGDPTRKVNDAWVSPMYMAAQARVVVPTITLAPELSFDDLLGSPVSRSLSDTDSTYVGALSSVSLDRDAWWTSNSQAGNPPQYPWLYTRDFFTQPTQGQNQASCLIQNTGVSVGQVLSLFGFVWDPARNSGLGGVVPMADIEYFELITGGSLVNRHYTPQALTDKMQSAYGPAIVGNQPDGTFVLDFALSEDGTYFSNAEAINTYLVNGVSLNIKFNTGAAPSATSTVYMGVEALKLATS